VTAVVKEEEIDPVHRDKNSLKKKKESERK